MMKNLRKLVLMVLCAVAISSAAGQKKVEVAVGECRDYSIRVAKTKAIRAAKLDAVEKAGVPEHIVGHTERYTSTSKESSQIRVYVKVVDLLTQEATVSYEQKDLSLTYKIEDGECYVKAEIRNAKVWEDKEDPNFTFDIKGLPSICEEGSKLSFQVTPSQDCYIRIFFFDISSVTDDTEMLFPYEASDDQMFVAGQTVVFPPSDSRFVRGGKYDWRAGKDDKSEEVEEVAILVVALKDDVRSPKDVSWNNVVEWMHSIPSDRRTFQVLQISIAKNRIK